MPYLTKRLCNFTSRSRFAVSQMPTIPVIQNQRKIPFVEKIPSSVREMNGTNNDQSVIQEHFERESRTTGSEYNKNNQKQCT